MASKRHHNLDYVEDSYSDDDDEMDIAEEDMDPMAGIPEEQEVQQTNGRPKPGRPRKASVTTNSSMDTISTLGLSSTRKRGRGPSKRPCLNRNALMARENRQRKKEYIERIESKLRFYQEENQELNSTISKQGIEIKRLTNEVAYLKTVLNNNTMISALLKSMNESLRKMHGSSINETDSNVTAAASVHASSGSGGKAKASNDVLNWVVSGQQMGINNTSRTNQQMAVPFSGSMLKNDSGICTDDSNRRIATNHQGISGSPSKIARKTLPYTQGFIVPTKIENPSSVESLLEEDDKTTIVQNPSPESASYCEYITDKNSMGLDNQLPTTPISTLSNSMDKGEASLSNTDFSQLSSFNVDLFDNFEVPNSLNFEQDAPDLFNEDTLFHSLDKDQSILSNPDVIDPLELSKMSDALNEKTLFNSLENTGVCLHINSNRVSLEYCSICHLNSLNSEIV